MKKPYYYWGPVALILGLAAVAGLYGDWWLMAFDLVAAVAVGVGGAFLFQADRAAAMTSAAIASAWAPEALVDSPSWNAHLAECQVCRDFWKADRR